MLVSIIIPCFNVRDYVGEAIKSTLNQSYPYIEIIIVDNQSDDDTLDVIKFYKQKDARVRYFVEPKKGAPFARNLGLNKANGTWVQFLDADDLLLPGRIEHLLSISTKDVNFVVSPYLKQLENGQIEKVALADSNEPWLALMESKVGVTSSLFFRKKVLMDCGGWNVDQKSSQEAELLFRLFKKNYFPIFDELALTIKRVRPFGQISDGSILNEIRYIELRLDIINYLKACKYKIWQNQYHKLYKIIYDATRRIARLDPRTASLYYNLIPANLKLDDKKSKLIKFFIDTFGFISVAKTINLYSRLSKNY